MGHVILTTPITGQFVLPRLRLEVAYMYKNFDHSAVREMIGTERNKWVLT